MYDVAPDILELVREYFAELLADNKIIQEIEDKISAGIATYGDADVYAVEIGDMLAKAYMKITGDMLPDGKMYYNIAEKVLRPTLEENYAIVSDMAERVQKGLNTKAGLGLNAIKPDIDNSRVDGFIDRVADADSFDSIKWILEEPVRNFAQNIVDETVRQNANFHANIGLKPKIVRKAEARRIDTYYKYGPNGKRWGPYIQYMPCQWCLSLEGEYNYEDVSNTGNDVFRRHERCRCIVEYYPGDGRVQNAHTKKWAEVNTDAIADRVNLIDSLQKIDNVNSWAALEKVLAQEGLELEPGIKKVLTLSEAKQRYKTGITI